MPMFISATTGVNKIAFPFAHIIIIYFKGYTAPCELY